MVDTHRIEKLQDAKAKVWIQISGETTAKEYQKIIDQYSKNIEFKGFRKGKTPREIIERKYSRELRAETFSAILEQSTREILSDIDPKPLPYSQPYITDPDGDGQPNKIVEAALLEGFQPGKPVEFAIAYDITPEVPVASVDQIKITPVQVEISEDELASELEQLREQNSVMMEKTDAVPDTGDIVSVQFAALKEDWEEGTEPPEKTRLRTVVRIGEDDIYNFTAAIQTLKANESKVLKGHSFPDEPSIPAELRGQICDIWLSPTSIRSRSLPDLDDDFAQDIDDTYETLDDLKKAIRKRLEHNAEHLTENYSLMQIYEQWANTLYFSIPRSMAAFQTQNMLENMKQRVGGSEQNLMMYLAMSYGGDTQQAFRKLEQESIFSLFVHLLREELLKSKDWKATPEELDQELEHMASHQNVSAEQLRERYAQQQEQWEDLLGRNALAARLTRELLAEVPKAAGEKMTVAELRQKLQDLEARCHSLVYERFSPFATDDEASTLAEPTEDSAETR